jgi:NADH dehydrogenase
LRNIIIRNFETALLTDDPELVESLMAFVIVGGGPTGVELAGALAELKLHVFPTDYRELEIDNMTIHLVEAGGRLLNGMSETASKKALEYLEKMSVKVHLNCAVKSYDGHEITLSTGNKLISRTMIWAAGVTAKPVDGISPEMLGRSGRIKVDEFNRVIGHKNIFAIGDAAIMEGDTGYPQGHPQMAPPAMQQGRLVAENIKRLIRKKPMKPFRYRHKGTMATIGRNKAVVDMGKLKWQGFFAWLVWMFVHLMSLIGFKNKLFVLFSWILSYLSYDKSNRLIIARPKDGVN